MPLLSIAVPTYNRPNFLKEKLEQFYSVSNKDIEFIVIDNNSCYDKSLVFDNQYNLFKNLKYIKNNINIGASANILRCFEYASGDWVWILSDDDKLAPNAIEIVYNQCKVAKDYSYINFNSTLTKLANISRATDITVTGLGELIENIDSFSNLLFISVGVYRTNDIVKFIRSGYHASNTFAPHLAMLFELLQSDNNIKVLLSEKFIIEWTPANAEQRWEHEVVNKGLQKLLELIHLINDRLLLAKIFEKENITTILPRKIRNKILFFGAKNNKAEELFVSNVECAILLKRKFTALKLVLLFVSFELAIRYISEKTIMLYEKLTNKTLGKPKSAHTQFNQSKRL